MEILPKWMTGDKKKKKTDWKGATFPTWTEGQTNEEHNNNVKAWRKANPNKKIPDSLMYYLDDPENKPSSTKKKKPNNPMRIKRNRSGKIIEMGAARGGPVGYSQPWKTGRKG